MFDDTVLKKYLFFFVILFMLCSIVKNASATNFTWKGTASNAWSNGANWSGGSGLNFPGSTLGVTDNVTISISATITYDGTLILGTIGTIVINNPTTLTLSASLTASGSVTIGAATTITGGSTLTGSSLSLTSTSTLTLNTNVNISGAATLSNSPTISIGSGYTLAVTGTMTSQTNSASITITGAGAATLGGYTFAYQSTLTIGSSGVTSTTVTINSGSTVSMGQNNNALTNYGTFNVNSSTITTTTNKPQPVAITNSGTFNLNSGSSLLSYGNSFTLTNTGTFNVTSATITYESSSGGGAFNNTYPGTLTATSSNIYLQSGTASTITNTGSFTATLCTIYIGTGVTPGYLTNSGTGASFTANGCTFTTGQPGTAGSGIINSGTMTLQAYTNPSTLVNTPTTLAMANDFGITNSGTFYAGTSNSPCTISTGTDDAANTTVINNSGTFILGSTSIITLNNTNTSFVSTIANTGSFTLMSDQYGSATFGPSGTPTYAAGSANLITGSYNVQRYITGTTGSSGTAYQGYRLLSSPVNTASYAPGSANYIPFNNLYNSETVNGTTYYGAITGGPGGQVSGGYGFYLNNANPTIYLWDENLNPVSGTQDKLFTSGNNVGLSANTSSGLTLTSTLATFSTTNVPAGNGYILYYIGSTNGPNQSGYTGGALDNATITNIGNINQDNIKVYLWYTPGGGSSGQLSYTSVKSISSYRGLNMIGNPYPSTIDLNLVYNDNKGTLNNTAPTFYELVDNSQSSTSYVSYIPNNGTSGGGGQTSNTTYSSEYVASGQGFFVTATAAGQSITFREGEKVYNSALLTETSSPPIVLARKEDSGALNGMSSTTRAIVSTPANVLAGLHLKVANKNGAFDECGIYFSTKWSDNYDNYDAVDFNPTSAAAYISSFTSDGILTGINSLSDYIKGKRIKLYVSANAGGLYNVTMPDIANIDTSAFNIYLVDNKLQDSIDIVRYKTYNFNISTSDTTTFGSDRFVLAIERKPLPPYELVSFTGQKASNGVLLTWKTYNEGDYTGFALQKLEAGGKQYTTLYAVQGNGQGTYTYTDPNPVTGNNMYRLMQNNIDSVITYTNPLNVLYTISTSSGVLSVYPNPAHETITVNFNSATAANGTYQASIYNSLGVLMMQASVSTNTWTQDVSSLKPGAYILKVTASNGTAIGNSKFIKYQ